MVLLIDNYDSFTYNIVQLAGRFTADLKVVRNDALTVDQVRALRPSHILLSPGPGYPREAGICEQVIADLGPEVPILGVCLGHQAICEVYGATIDHARRLMHGKKSALSIRADHPLFRGLPDRIEAARYHSLAARRETIPDCLEILAEDDLGEVMAVAHRQHPVYGLQFHPESVLTPDGDVILGNFLKEGARP